MFYLILIGIFSNVHSFVPRDCAANATTTDKICCPIPKGFSIPCGGPGRGICETVRVHEDTVQNPPLNDDRINWPIKFFKQLCRCEGSFYGPACDQCWYGWEGEKCDRRKIITRRNILSFNETEKERFVKIVQLSYSTPSEFMILGDSDSSQTTFIPATVQQHIAFIHYYAIRSGAVNNELCNMYTRMNFNHFTVSFGTWHRALMLYWESELAKIALREFNWKDFGIPYWDWFDATECEVCTNDLVGAVGDYDLTNGVWRLDTNSPFYNWTEYCYQSETANNCFGCQAQKNIFPLNRRYSGNPFPVTQDLRFTLLRSSYYLQDEMSDSMSGCRTFRLALEGFCGRSDAETSPYMHNLVHTLFRGTFSSTITSPDDPLFILHHGQVERIIECWFQIFSPSIYQLPNHLTEPGNSRESNVVGFIPIVKHAQLFTKVIELGYTFDNLNFGKEGFKCLEMAEWIRSNKV